MIADNQQERLSQLERYKWFLAGIIEGEGSVCVSIKQHPTAKFGYYVDPEFFIYQSKNCRYLLDLALDFFKTGRIFPKPGNTGVLVYAISDRRSISEKVIPFLRNYMQFSAKKEVYSIFAEIVEAMEQGKHRSALGLIEIVEKAYRMNPNTKGK